MKFQSFVLIAGMAVSVGFLSAQEGSEYEPKISHYVTISHEKDQPVSTHHYQFADRVMKLRMPEEYRSYESERGDFIRLSLTSDAGYSMTLGFVGLEKDLKTPKEAEAYYREALAKNGNTLEIRNVKVDNRLKPPLGKFPLSFLLAENPQSPIREIHTFFIHPPYLYSVSITTSGKMTGRYISDCSKVMRSISVEPPPQKETAVPLDSPTGGRMDFRAGKGDGTSPLDAKLVTDSHSLPEGSGGSPASEQSVEEIQKMIRKVSPLSE